MAERSCILLDLVLGSMCGVPGTAVVSMAKDVIGMRVTPRRYALKVASAACARTKRNMATIAIDRGPTERRILESATPDPPTRQLYYSDLVAHQSFLLEVHRDTTRRVGW